MYVDGTSDKLGAPGPITSEKPSGRQPENGGTTSLYFTWFRNGRIRIVSCEARFNGDVWNTDRNTMKLHIGDDFFYIPNRCGEGLGGFHESYEAAASELGRKVRVRISALQEETRRLYGELALLEGEVARRTTEEG